jgi:hypothetical protein
MDNLIGITEGADPTINLKWRKWVQVDKRPAIIISKAPSKLIPMLDGTENIIIHCTITGLGGTLVEPKINPYPVELEAYHKLCNLFGKERIVLRIDPIIYNSVSDINPYKTIAKEAEGRMRISFLDLYPHVKQRFDKQSILVSQSDFHQPLQWRNLVWKELGKPEVCAEPDIPSSPCVGIEDCKILNVIPSTDLKGQRKLCGCLANKVELCTRPPKCTYGCLYCYWR